MDDHQPELSDPEFSGSAPEALEPAPPLEAVPGPVTAPPPPLAASPGEHPSARLAPTRLSAAWTAAVVAIVLVVAMLIFILQNERTVPISFVSVHGHLPLGVALLFSAVAGAVIVVGCGAARIFQLRRVAKRRGRATHSHEVARPATTP